MNPPTRSACTAPLRRLAATLLCMAFGPAVAATPEAVAREALLDALAPALAIRGATAVVTVAPPDARRQLASCQMAGFLPPGARLAGKTLVGVRCVEGASGGAGGANWQAFLSAEVRAEGPAWQTTRALRAGETLAGADLVQARVALTAADLETAALLARSAPGKANAGALRGLASLDGRTPAPIGRIVLRPVAAGRALTASDVRDEGRIAPGDAVRVVYAGDGFSVSSEGHAVGAADPGSPVVIRLASGALVSGTLRADRRVELPR